MKLLSYFFLISPDIIYFINFLHVRNFNTRVNGTVCLILFDPTQSFAGRCAFEE